MMSGAFSWISRFRRLFRLMTRRYSYTYIYCGVPAAVQGDHGPDLRGMTGSTSMIIHSGLLPDRRKASTTSSA